ncbi:MAG: hypothetical protein KGK08_02485 [Acidobacteriota bacterium]|nr:hypothetical protein [Acidobacteriota bacterium]
MGRRVGSLVAGVLFGLVGAGLTGCNAGGAGSLLTQGTGSTTTAVKTRTGVVHGGQNPVVGASIQLWTVGTTGYGSAGTQLLTSPVTTDGSGGFNLSTLYTCPSASTLVYLTATGGNPGSGTNTAIRLVAPLGQCGSLNASTFIVVNEVTTIATAYALGQFVSPTTGAIGSYGNSQTGIINAFATVNNLVNISSGAALATTPGGNGTVPQAELNTLGDVLAACVNSTGSTSTLCSTLFSLTTPSGGSAPTDTLLAALSIAQHPVNNVSTLFGQVSASGTPFLPTLSSAPGDWTVSLSYAAGGVNAGAVAVDGSGNVWLANAGQSGGAGATVSELTPTGTPFSGSPYSNGVAGATVALAIDTNGKAWVSNSGAQTLTQYASGGNVVSGPMLVSTGILRGVAVDAYNDLWATSGNALLEVYGAQTISGNSGYAGGATDTAVALDSQSNAWALSTGGSGGVLEFNPYGILLSPSTGYTANLDATNPVALAVDGSDNVWVTNNVNKLVKLNSSGVEASPSGGYSYGVSSIGTALAVDGNNNIWLTTAAGSVAEVTQSGTLLSGSFGYTANNVRNGDGIAVDGSGNVWISSNISSGNTLTELVGAAVPVAAPLSSSVALAQAGRIPGTLVPVSITTSSLPVYMINQTYTAQLYAAGGNSNGSYTWTLSSGALPTGLSLSSSGQINGTATVSGSYTIGVSVTDGINPATTATLHLYASTNLPTQGSEAALNGSYVIRGDLFRNASAYGSAASTGSVYGQSLVGTLVFNGAGGITGEVDSNGPGTSGSGTVSVTGSYSVGTDNRGLIVLTPSASGSRTIEFSLSVGNFSGPVAQSFRVAEFDDTEAATGGQGGRIGAGEGKRQTAATLTAQTYVFGMEGESTCTNVGNTNPSCLLTATPFGPLGAVGKIVMNGSNGTLTGEEDTAGTNVTYNLVGLTGTFTTPDSFGRGTLTLVPGSTMFTAPPTNYAYYVVGSGELFLMSTDSHASFALLSGDALAQVSGVSSSTLTGNYVGYESTSQGGDAISQPPQYVSNSLFYLSIQSGNTFNLIQDRRVSDGQTKLEQSQTGLSFSVDTAGRMTLGGGAPVFYVADSGHVFGMEQPNGTTNTGTTGLIVLQQQQTLTSTGCSSLSGSFMMGSSRTQFAVGSSTGEIVFSGGVGTTTSDGSNLDGTLVQGNTDTINCTPDNLTSTTGRLAFNDGLFVYPSPNGGGHGASFVMYPITQNGLAVVMPMRPSKGYDSLLIIQK